MTRARVAAHQLTRPPKSARLLRGTVAAVSPLTVQIAGGAAVGGMPIPGASYTVGDVVLVLVQEPGVGPVYPIAGATAVPASTLTGTVPAAALAGLLTVTGANLAALPNGAAIGQLGIALDTGITYRWMGATPKWYPWHSGWLSYSPAWAGVTPGTGSSSTARYRWVDGLVQARAWLIFGSAPAITAQVTHALPEPARVVSNSAWPSFVGSVIVRDPAGTNFYPGALRIGDTSSTASLYAQNAAGTYLTYAAMNASGIPIAVAQSEQIFTDLTYESTNYPLS
jgi:hypothetical protein